MPDQGRGKKPIRMDLTQGPITRTMLMFSLPPENWLRLGIWLAIGLCVYFGYGKKHSALRKRNAQAG